jgi:transcriptional regulator with XRE-family HTH domain
MEVTSTIVDDPEVRTEAELFGRRLRSIRLDRGWTQEQLAERAEITPTYTSDLERAAKVPSLTIKLRLARAFDIDVSELLVDFSRDSVRRMKLD